MADIKQTGQTYWGCDLHWCQGFWSDVIHTPHHSRHEHRKTVPVLTQFAKLLGKWCSFSMWALNIPAPDLTGHHPPPLSLQKPPGRRPVESGTGRCSFGVAVAWCKSGESGQIPPTQLPKVVHMSNSAAQLMGDEIPPRIHRSDRLAETGQLASPQKHGEVVPSSHGRGHVLCLPGTQPPNELKSLSIHHLLPLTSKGWMS